MLAMPNLYSPLDAAAGEIRLLTLEPGLPGSPIECKLTTKPLGDFSRHPEGIYRWSGGGLRWIRYQDEDGAAEVKWHPLFSYIKQPDTDKDAKLVFTGSNPAQTADVPWVPSYEALSYTWSNASDSRLVKINGFEVDITANLHSALQHLRKTDAHRVLWVDALCINQMDLEEKCQQIQRMRSIYQRATQTLVWLGDASDDSDQAIELLERLGGKYRDLARFSWDMIDWHGPQFEPFHGIGRPVQERADAFKKHMGSLDLLSPADLKEEDWRALDNLFRRPWWKRSWVIQEVANAQSVELFYGAASLGWGTFDSFPYNEKFDQDPYLSDRFRRILYDSGAGALIYQRLTTRNPLRAYGYEFKITEFSTLLLGFRHCGATDPRDKVYSLLGLASVTTNMAFTPDYTRSVRATYCDIVRAVIHRERNLRLLCLAHTDAEVSEYDLPSWAPNWTVQPETVPLVDPFSTERQYTASANSVAEGPSFPASQDNEIESRRSGADSQSSDGGWTMTVKTASWGRHDGLPERPALTSSTADPTNETLVILRGIDWDDVVELGERIPDDALQSDAWRAVVKSWEPEALRSDVERHPSFPDKHPLRTFWYTLLRSIIAVPAGSNADDDAVDWMEVYHEQYLVWCGRLSADEVNRPDLAAMIGELDGKIKENLRGWRFCLTNQHSMAMVPNRAAKGDIIAVLFGADVPLVLRPQPGAPGQYKLVGTAYVSGIMDGAVMEELKKGTVEEKEFTLC